MRRLTFSEFWEALVRCALVAYSDVKLKSRKTPFRAVGFYTLKEVSPSDKLRNMFLFMWRSINNNIPRALGIHSNVGTYTGHLIQGAQDFSNAFTADWKRHDLCDYLRDVDTEEMPARKVLRGLLENDAAGGEDSVALSRDTFALSDAAEQSPPAAAPLSRYYTDRQELEYSGSREQLAELMRARGDL
jgi:hypothetical protein